MDYRDLLIDPRPELTHDTNNWKRLLRLIPELSDKGVAELLQRRLWTLRSLGVILKPTRDGLKFIPLIGPECSWEYEIDFEDLKVKYLKPYAAEIKYLLERVLEP